MPPPKLLYADTNANWSNYQQPALYKRGVYDLGHNLYAFLSPNGSWNETNTGLIIGDGEALLIDTLIDLPHTQAMLTLMQPLTRANPLRYVINTHADGDHCWGNELITGAEIISSQACHEEMQELTPRAYMSIGTLGKALSLIGRLPGLGRYRRIGNYWQRWLAPYNAAPVKVTLPTRCFSGELTLEVGGRCVQLLEVGPMHTRGDILVYVPDARTLYAGDALFVGVTPVLWAGPLSQWISTLEKILAMDVDTIIPGHGPISDKEGVRQIQAYWQFLAERAEEHYQAGLSAEKAAYAIARSATFASSPFATWDAPERMMVNLHTLYRWFEGRPSPPHQLERLRILARQATFAGLFS